jgi:hemerythrin
MARKKSEVALQVEKDHEGLNQDMGALKMTLMKEIAAKDFPNWRLEFIWQLRDFKNRLLKHFDLEEEGGFMEEVLSVAPHTERKVKVLKEEHEQFVVELDEILTAIKGMQEKNNEELDSIRNRLTELISALRQHEAEENQLMQTAYFQEYGGPA